MHFVPNSISVNGEKKKEIIIHAICMCDVGYSRPKVDNKFKIATAKYLYTMYLNKYNK